jgi:hypothetical protein
MAICRIIETGVAPEQYDQVREQLGLGDSPPPGASLHIAARGEDGTVRIVEVWDSREQAEEFGERVRKAREGAGIGGEPPSISYLEVYNLVQA